MKTDMDAITMMIGHWLKSNNLPTEGARIILELPTYEAACRAQMSIKAEIEPMRAFDLTGGSFGEIETMNGLGLTLRSAGPQR